MNRFEIPVYLITIFAANNNILYCQTLQWRTLPNFPIVSSRFEDVYFINAGTGWVVSISDKIFKTTKGGNSWDTMFTALSGSFRSIGFFDSENGILRVRGQISYL